MRFAEAFAGQVVVVAGAGGYIGSSLVKALAPHTRMLILLDNTEHGLFQIQRWMEWHYSSSACVSIVGSVDDVPLLREIFTRFRPRLVFHAAAFKHVGLMEQNPFAAIRNNALGGYTFAKEAIRHDVSKFVLISTDKAVNPHSVMGVSKRIAELFTLSGSACVIRLVNVIGSTGSVIPLFLEQIENRQALCVTHPDASRYFLSIDETVQSILAAGLGAGDGVVYLPRLAEPLPIANLARLLIGRHKLPIRFIGLKPGEKLTEDLIGRDEATIGVVDGPLTVVKTRRLARADCDEAALRLAACVARRDLEGLLDILSGLVPEYVPSTLMQSPAVVA